MSRTGGGGVVFELAPSGGNWNFTPLYTFNQPGSAAEITDTLARDPAGNLYGTTWQGIDGGCAMGQGCGNVFEVAFSSGTWTYKDLHDFQESDGGKPWGGVILDSAGNLYGTTWEGGSTSPQCAGGDYFGCGVVFEITP